jgi:RNA polymerase sigma-70 factor, ECF subfamily
MPLAAEPDPPAAAPPLTAATFEALYRATVDDLFAYVAALVRDRGVAEDVVAAAFERAYADDGPDPVRRATVRAALAGLEPRDRELVALKFFAGLDNAEIAGVLGISPSNAGTRLHRAVHRLREACHAPS